MPSAATTLLDPPALRADPRFGRLLGHVDDKRGRRRWASRADIDACEIPNLLAHTWVIEVAPRPVASADPRLLVRLAGTQIERIYGRSLAGEYLESLDWGAHSTRIFASLNRMADLGHRHFLDASASIRPRLSRRVRRLGIPLSGDQQRVSHLLLLAYYEFNAGAPDHFHEIWLDSEETGFRAPNALNDGP